MLRARNRDEDENADEGVFVEFDPETIVEVKEDQEGAKADKIRGVSIL